MNNFGMKSIILLFFILCNLYHFNEAKITAAPSTQIRLTCNQTLAPGSTLALTDKLDLSGRQPDQPKSITDSCSIVGPSKNEVMFVKANLKPSIYHTVDFVSNRLINLIQDITKNGLQKNYYDLVIIWHVLEHIKEDPLILQRLSEI